MVFFSSRMLFSLASFLLCKCFQETSDVQRRKLSRKRKGEKNVAEEKKRIRKCHQAFPPSPPLTAPNSDSWPHWVASLPPKKKEEKKKLHFPRIPFSAEDLFYLAEMVEHGGRKRLKQL